jgi:hypothetical protein
MHTGAAMSEAKPQTIALPSGKVVGQYFGIFHGCSKAQYEKIVNTAPFYCCNLLILAFVWIHDSAGLHIPKFSNFRDNKFNGGKATPDDTDEDRVRLIVATARAKNPGIKILISLGWGNNDTVMASETPQAFAEGIRGIVQTYGLDGFDIDYESIDDQNGAFKANDLIRLAQTVRQELDQIIPKREMIMTITPADYTALNKEALEQFTYTMPQSYGHGGNSFGGVEWYQQQLGSFAKIVYGLSGEGYTTGDPMPDDPTKYVADAKSNAAAGVFSWRLDTDSMDKQTLLPTFATGIEMWKLMNSP